MKTIKIRIGKYARRERMITALAEEGIKVWIEEKKGRNYDPDEYCVCFELPDEDPKTMKFSIEPKKGDDKFASQRESNER